MPKPCLESSRVAVSIISLTPFTRKPAGRVGDRHTFGITRGRAQGIEMDLQETHRQGKSWVAITKRVYLWEQPPETSTLRDVSIKGYSDSGQIECNGSMLRFNGKEKQIEMPEMKDVSEIRARFRLSDFFLFWLCGSVAVLLTSTLLNIITPWGSIVLHVIGATLLALIGAILYWLGSRKYGRCARVTFGASDGELRQLFFFAPPISGGSHKLYKTLHKKLIA